MSTGTLAAAAPGGATAERRSVAFWIRTAAYCLLTGIIALEMVAGSVWDLGHIEYVRVVFARLGYPLFLLNILGVWKFPCAVTLVLPRFLRLKEWAYAGAVFLYTGAAASHQMAGEPPSHWVGPLVFALMTLGSWALRPASRRLSQGPAPAAPSKREWIVSAAALAVMIVFALVSIPKGPPPG